MVLIIKENPLSPLHDEDELYRHFSTRKKGECVCATYTQCVEHNLGTYLLSSDNDLDSRGNDRCFGASAVASVYPDNR